MPINLESRLWRSVLPGVAGFLVYGGWSYWVNSDHGHGIGLRSGLLQGSYSFLLTLSTSLIADYLFAKSNSFFITIAALSGTQFLVAFGIHFMVGTPMIVMTILPGWIIGTVYVMFYILALSRAHIEPSERHLEQHTASKC